MTAKIYKLSSLVNDKVYIGSTCNPLNVRMAQHILSHWAFKSGNNSKCISSYDIIDMEEYKIQLIEECDIQNRFIREQYYIDTIKCINKNSAYTGIIGNQKTKESWNYYQRMHYALNRQDHLARKLSYYYKNKETIKNKRQIKKRFENLPFSLTL
jgi:hypothetical protein